MNYTHFFYSIILIVGFTACKYPENNPNCHTSISIINLSNRDIYYDATFSEEVSEYPPTENSFYQKIKSNSTNILHNGYHCYEKKKEFDIGKKLKITFFDAQEVESIDWNSLRKNEKYYLLQYNLKLDDLKSLGWIVTYGQKQ